MIAEVKELAPGGEEKAEFTGDMLGSAEWQRVIAELEFWKKSVHDYGDLAKYDLQSAYQDYSQQVQALAGNQKQLYDDAMKILNQFKP